MLADDHARELGEDPIVGLVEAFHGGGALQAIDGVA
jgi:hypothetical protein